MLSSTVEQIARFDAVADKKLAHSMLIVMGRIDAPRVSAYEHASFSD
jgi:hypothetical protein